MWMYIAAVLVLAADQLTKQIAVRALMHLPGYRYPVIPGTLDFYLQANTGGAFSLLRGYPIVITIFSVVAIALIFFWARKLPRSLVSARVAFGLIFGGAIGNLIDRISLNYVIDFIHVYYKDWVFPTFNVADSAITIGIILFLYLSLFTKKLDGNVVPAANDSQGVATDEQPPDTRRPDALLETEQTP